MAFAQDSLPALQTLHTAEFVVDDTVVPPSAEANWQTMELPLASRSSSADNSNRVYWFRFHIDQPQDDILYSLYFYRYNRSVDVYFNGERIGGDTHRENRQTVAWNHPLLLELRSSDWQTGENELLVRFQSTYFGGTFAPVIFGPFNELKPQFDARMFRQVTLNLWMLIFGFFVSLLALALWVLRRQDRNYLLFAGISICWMIVTAHMVLYYFPFAYRFWLPLVHMAVDVWLVLFYFFLSRLLDLPSPKIKKLLVILLIPTALWHCLTILEYWWIGAYLIHLFGYIFILYMFVRIIHKAWVTKSGLAVSIALAICVQFAFFAHDWLQSMYATPQEWESGIYLSQFAFPFMQAVFLATLLVRFINALKDAELLNMDLEAKVEQSRILIETAYAERRQLELSEAAEKERVRIYRELHDEVGSKLLSIVHAGRETRLGALATAALESLRNSVSRANNPDQKAEVFFAVLKEETALRITGSGHELTWHQPVEIEEFIIPSVVAFNLNRIFKELVSNIIRHANASQVSIEISQNGGLWTFLIKDNGIGFDGSASKGNGIDNINSRAREINASVEWQAAPGAGVEISIILGLADSLVE